MFRLQEAISDSVLPVRFLADAVSHLTRREDGRAAGAWGVIAVRRLSDACGREGDEQSQSMLSDYADALYFAGRLGEQNRKSVVGVSGWIVGANFVPRSGHQQRLVPPWSTDGLISKGED